MLLLFQSIRTGAILMGKLINEPVILQPLPKRGPQRKPESQGFLWRGRLHRIEAVGGEWRLLGRWWEGEGERRYLRAITSTGLALDLCQDLVTGRWVVHEMPD
jgi:hypothetical protein